jgi:hypothetical protein
MVMVGGGCAGLLSAAAECTEVSMQTAHTSTLCGKSWRSHRGSKSKLKPVKTLDTNYRIMDNLREEG